MRFRFRNWLTLLLTIACLGWQSNVLAHAQNESAPGTATSTASPKEPAGDSEDINQFRHAPIVKGMAKMFGMDVEGAARLFEIINSAILVFVILYFLAKIVPNAIRARNANIQKRLEEARAETKTANERLGAVEAKLARIGDEIEAIRQQTERDLVGDEKRIRQALDDERQRIVQSAEQEIESAGAAARRDLKHFAAELAIANATRRIQMTAESDRAMIERFGRDLTSNFGKGGRN